MHKIKIMVINSQPSFTGKIRQALKRFDNAEILDCDPGNEGNNAITQIAAKSPDIVLLGIGFPQLKGLKLADKITRVYPAVAVIAASTNPEEDDDEIFEVIKCRAADYVRCNERLDLRLYEIIERISRGDFPFNVDLIFRPGIALRILRQLQYIHSGRQNEYIVVPFTFEEICILKLISLGNTRAQIATILGMSDKMINNQIDSMIQKMVTNNRTSNLVNQVRSDLMSVRIARYGNLLLFGNKSNTCRFQPSN